MNRFWNGVIKPIVQEMKPSVIVEVGAADGMNSVKALEYCAGEKVKCKVHVIDPLVPAQLETNRELLEKYGTFHKELSLEVLPKVKGDLYLIDGDHNWYTVYNELKAVFADNPGLPTVFFHDISWPYARRDMYYNPSNIPPEFVHEYDQNKGIDLKTNQLLAESNFNKGLANAIAYGGPKNGVLTGIEDFIKDHDLKKTYEFYQLPILNGLGLLIPKKKLKGKVKELVAEIFELSPNFLDVLNIVERERLKYTRQFVDCRDSKK